MDPYFARGILVHGVPIGGLMLLTPFSLARWVRRSVIFLLALLVGPAVLLAAPAEALAVLNTPPTARATATPNPAHVDEVVMFDGSGSTDTETLTGLEYSWNFGDGTPATELSRSGFEAQHTYTRAGVFTATLTVRDADGATDTDRVIMEVDDTAPVAALNATPSSAKVGETVSLDASDSSDAEDPNSLTYDWDFGDGTTQDDGGSAMEHVYNQAGTYQPSVTVTDPQGASDTAQVTVTVTNTAPEAVGTVTPAQPRVSQTVTFDGSGSSDAEDPNSLTYDWDFGDGSPHATTAIANHEYQTAGLRSVTLTVTDPQGLSDTYTTTLTVGSNTAPTADAQASRTRANAAQLVSFDGSSSTDAETPQSLTYAWNFGDGSPTASGATTEHAYSAPGTYTATLTVSDPKGLTGSDTVTIIVGNLAPTAAGTVTPSPAYALQGLTFDATASDDAETPDQLTYSWDFGDGSQTTAYSSSPTASHSYAEAGSYTATLRVKDPKGATGSTTMPVEVLPNAAPNAVAESSPSAVSPGQLVTFNGTGSSDPDGDALTYLWEFPGSGTATTATTTRTFPTEGTYQVKLTVTDNHGVADTAITTVEVVAVLPCEDSTVRRTGSWRVVTGSTASGGSHCDNLGTGTGRDRLVLDVNGPTFGLTYGRARRGGSAKVFVDGTLMGTVKFYRSKRAVRFGYVRTFTGLGEGAHRVRLVVRRGAAYVDDFRLRG